MHNNFPNNGIHIVVSKGCKHQNYPEGQNSCVRTEPMMIGYLFSPVPEIKGTKL